MAYKKLVAIAIVVVLIGCKPNKAVDEKKRQPMFTAYNDLNSAISNGQLDAIIPMLNLKSRDFYNKITEPKNLNLDSIISIGMQYKVPYFAMKYLGSCGDFMKTSSDPTDFFRFLANSDISIFSDSINYKLYKEESRLEKNAFVAITKKEGKVLKVNWVKFTRPDSSSYKYDLIYNLKIEERMNRIIFKEQRKKHYKLTDEEFIKMYYPTFDKQVCSLSN